MCIYMCIYIYIYIYIYIHIHNKTRYPVQGDQLGLGVDTFKLLF